MLLVGLTGGLASGKSTVAAMLRQRGAVVIDADELARRAVEPGTPGLAAVVAAFGPAVVDAEGRLDREALAAVAFADDEARQRLEAIVHPEVFQLLAAELERHRASGAVVVFEAPLLIETGLDEGCDVVVTVSAAEDRRVERAVSARGIDAEDARARLRAQLSDAEREARADVVVRNDADVDELERRVEALWQDLRERARG